MFQDFLLSFLSIFGCLVELYRRLEECAYLCSPPLLVLLLLNRPEGGRENGEAAGVAAVQ